MFCSHLSPSIVSAFPFLDCSPQVFELHLFERKSDKCIKRNKISTENRVYNRLNRLNKWIVMQGFSDYIEHGSSLIHNVAVSQGARAVSGYLWVGKNLVPRLLFYSFFFMGAFGAEITISLLGFLGFGFVPDISFLYLTVMTAVAMCLFLFEGTSLNKKFKNTN